MDKSSESAFGNSSAHSWITKRRRKISCFFFSRSQ